MSTTPIDLVLSRLNGCKKSGEGYKALCPAHDDKMSSLSISEGEGGRVIIHCHANCPPESVVQAMGLRMRDLFPQEGKPEAPKAPPRAVDAYDYTDADGALIFQVVRYVPKNFKQRRPNGKGGWLWNMNGVQRVLYRLPQVLAAVSNGETVFVVEGEKDADNLAKLGLCATTNAGGAEKWLDGYSETLRNTDVAILPDNDKAGEKHAEKVALSLYNAGARSRIVRLPGLPEKGDVSDWLNAGGTSDELARLVVEASMWEITPAAVQQGIRTTADPIPEVFGLSDLGNARRLVHFHGKDLRYCFPWARWFHYDGQRFNEDITGELMRRAQDIPARIHTEAAEAEDPSDRKKLGAWSLRSESNTVLRATIEQAKALPGIPVKPDEFDADPWLLNTLNGTLDLRTSKLREHRREDFLTKLAPVEYDPDAECPTFLTFLDRIMGHNQALIAFLQRLVGYSLTGITSERVIAILWGSGRNGKSTLLETIREMVGDYGARTPTESLMVKREGAISNDIARLRGARFVSASESEEGKRLAESLIKDLTGGDTITARFMRSEFFEFKPQFKIWLATNHKPVVKGTDKGIWDRIRLIPFATRITDEELDRNLLDKLRAELPGILAWAVRGCQEWQHEGLGTPEEVKVATEEYRADMDAIGQFIEECCDVRLTAKSTSGALYERYKAWCDANQENRIGQRAFGLRLQERGFTNCKGTGGVRCWAGVQPIGQTQKSANEDQGPSTEEHVW